MRNPFRRKPSTEVVKAVVAPAPDFDPTISKRLSVVQRTTPLVGVQEANEFDAGQSFRGVIYFGDLPVWTGTSRSVRETSELIRIEREALSGSSWYFNSHNEAADRTRERAKFDAEDHLRNAMKWLLADDFEVES